MAAYLLDDRAFVKLEVVLAQHGEPFPGSEGDAALCRAELARQNLHKCRFSGAVGAYDAIAVAVGKRQVDVLEKHSLSKLHS